MSDENDSLNTYAFKPNNYTDIQGFKKLEYRNYEAITAYDSSIFLNRKYKEYSWFRRKLLYENFIIIDTGKLYITIDPLLNVGLGKEAGYNVDNDANYNVNLRTNTRGILVRASIGKKFSVETYFYENQFRPPSYINDFILATGVVPGQGRVKNFKDNSYDFSQSGAYFSYTHSKNFDLQFGHHKHFIGDGYRSLILSDNSFNYPFLRFNLHSSNKKWHYSVMYAATQDLDRIDSSGLSEGIFRRKGTSIHLLEYNFSKRLKFYVTQSVMWPTENFNGDISFPQEMFNPVMFLHPAIKGMDGRNNTLMAAGFSVWPLKKIEVYGQFVVDDDKFKQTGYQGGVKVFPTKTTVVQIEGNAVGINTYASVSDEYYNAFANYNQAMAHTLGNNFEEIVVRAAHRYKRLIPEVQVNFSKQKSNMSEVLWAKFELAYLINPSVNMKIYASITERRQFDLMSNENFNLSLISFGIKSDLRNIYYDF